MWRAKAVPKPTRNSALLAFCLLTGPAVALELPPFGPYDSQLGGAYPPPPGVVSVSRDREDPAAPGLYSICYVNAFQTQPRDAGWWLANHPDLLLRKAGEPFKDANWPGEYLLDIGSVAKRDRLLSIVLPWIDGCATAGFQAIEADNLDTYSRSGGALRISDALAFGAALAAHAHARGLAFGQKNAGELGTRGRDAGFDFAIVESCQVYDECEDYIAVFGRNVQEIEYTDSPRGVFAAACAARGRDIPVVLRDRQLRPAGAAGHNFETC